MNTQWFPISEMPTYKISSEFLSWLLEEGSITQRLRTIANHFDVNVINTSWNKPQDSELNILASKDDNFFIREVELNVDHRPWIFGRTVIPQSTIKANEKNAALLTLGNQSLGDFLFKQSSLERKNIEYALIHSHVWARRSLFFLEGYPLLLKEIFLKDFPYQ